MSALCVNLQRYSCSCSKNISGQLNLPQMQVIELCVSLQAPGFLIFYTTLCTVAHARSTYIIASLPITCTFSCNFRYYELSLFSGIKQPSCKFLSLLFYTPSRAKGRIQFGRAFTVLTWGHIISQNLLSV